MLGGICWGGTVMITCSSAALFYVFLPLLPCFRVWSVVCVSGWRVWHGRTGEDLTVLHQLISWAIKNLQCQLICARLFRWICYSGLQQLGASDVFFDQPVLRTDSTPARPHSQPHYFNKLNFCWQINSKILSRLTLTWVWSKKKNLTDSSLQKGTRGKKWFWF